MSMIIKDHSSATVSADMSLLLAGRSVVRPYPRPPTRG